MVYLISYDLCGKDRGYAELARAITNAADGLHCWVCESTWLIQSKYTTAEDVYDAIKYALDRDDKCIVIEVSDNWVVQTERNKRTAMDKLFP